MINNLNNSRSCNNTTLSNRQTDHHQFYTIVVPVYNLESYIGDCIRSLQNQSFDDFECIIVDDGSTDRTTEVIKEAIKNDSRFKLISILHGGPQKAKNAGLNVASGEYIGFMDGDDTLESGCLKDCREKAEGCDMLIFGINYQQYVNRKLVSENPVSLKPMEFASGAELADWYIENRKLLIYSNANKFYRKDTLKSNRIRFREEISFGEDRLFNYDYLHVCKKICVLPGVYYNYRAINSESSTHSFRHYSIDELLDLHEEKIRCFCTLLEKTSLQAKEKFRKIDYDDSFYMALNTIREHRDILSSEEYADEMEHLESEFIQSIRTNPHRFILEHAWRSREKRIRDFGQQIQAFKTSDAMHTIIEIFNEAARKTECIKVLSECNDMYSFLAQFGVLKGEYFRSYTTEAATRINRLLDDRKEELYQALVALGFYTNNKPSFGRYDYILISGGANDANRLRTLKAKEVTDELIKKGKKPKMIRISTFTFTAIAI